MIPIPFAFAPSCVAQRVDLGFSLKELVDRARKDTKLSGDREFKHGVLASLMGLSSQQLSQQLAGNGHLSLSRLLMVGKDEDGRQFLAVFFGLMAEQLGFDQVVVANELMRISALLERVHVRMARASSDYRKEKVS